MPLREQQVPAVLTGVRSQLLDGGGVFDVEGQVIQSWAAAVVLFGGEGRGLFDDQVGRSEPPAAAGVPALEGGVTQRLQQPAERGERAVELRHPELDVIHRAVCWPAHTATTSGRSTRWPRSQRAA